MEEIEMKIAGLQLKETEIKWAMKKIKDEIKESETDSDTTLTADELAKKKEALLEMYEDRDENKVTIENLQKQLKTVLNEKETEITILSDNDSNTGNKVQKQVTEATKNNILDQSLDTRTSTYNDVTSSHKHLTAKPQQFKTGDDISLFFERFVQFTKLSRLSDRNLDLYVLTLIKDDKMYRKLKNVSLTEQQKADAELLVATYEKILFPATETRMMRSALTSLKQKNGESTEDFAIRIEEIGSKAYSNHDLKEEASLSVFMSGIRNIQIRQKLLEADVDTFEQATRMATKLEHISDTIADSENHDRTADIDYNVLSVNQRNNMQTLNPRIPPYQQTRPDNYNSPENCRTCGKSNHVTSQCWRNIACQTCAKFNHATARCWKNMTCFSCSRRGHLARECRAASRGGYNTQINANRSQNPNQRYDRQSNVTCFRCTGKGHYSYQCTMNNQQWQAPTAQGYNNQRTQSSTTRQENNPDNRNQNRRDQAPASPQTGNNDIHLNENTTGQFPVHPSRQI